VCEEDSSFTRTNWNLSDKYDLNQPNAVPLIPITITFGHVGSQVEQLCLVSKLRFQFQTCFSKVSSDNVSDPNIQAKRVLPHWI